MNIALTAHDAKKELMVQFCIAYCGILSRHNLCATGTTGKLVEEATGLSVHRFLSGPQGGISRLRRVSPATRSTFCCTSATPCRSRHWSRTIKTCSVSAT